MAEVPDELVSIVRKQKALIVAAAGVTIASVTESQRNSVTWAGLVDSGRRYVLDHLAGDEKWDKWVQGDLDNGGAEGLIAAAGKITNKMGGSHLNRWLLSSIGTLEPAETRLIDAIGSLKSPVATTNYDSLIEKRLDRESTDWTDASGMQRALTCRTNDVMHLHGTWRNASSVIFSSESYGAISANAAAQAIQNAAGISTTFVFVGAGDTIDDPNLGKLLTWLQNTIVGGDNLHYLLCKDSDVATLQDRLGSTALLVHGYGERYDDLAPFLEKLASNAFPDTDSARSVELSTASIHAMADRVRSEVIISSHAAPSELAGVKDLLIPPILLPVTHEEAITLVRDESGRSPVNRCKPHEEAAIFTGLIVVGAETSGLTSTLEWLVHERASSSRTHIPVIVNFPSLVLSAKPLERAIRRELSEIGSSVAPGEQLPSTAIAIDNVIAPTELESKTAKLFDRMAAELSSGSIDAFVIGCRPGAEQEIRTRLHRVGVTASTLFLGRADYSDAIALAKLVSPTRSEELARRAYAIVKKECLSRTPMTFALLMDVLLRGEVTLATASDTALLDAYVSLLLGRGDPYDDARFSLDSHDREALLSALAERFVKDDAGSVSQSTAVRVLEDLFSALGWNDAPMEVLDNLKSRHVIRYEKGQVKFTQTSFFHLFAAKEMIQNAEFKAYILSRPLYYAPIIGHYAALTRSDVEVLKKVGSLVSGDFGPAPEGGRILVAYNEAQQELSSDNLDNFISAIASSADALDAQSEEITNEDKIAEELPYSPDPADDTERAPFPAANVDDAPPLMKAVSAVALVSSVLRDSELVKNVDLKTKILGDTLFVWGRLVQLLDTNRDFQEYTNDLVGEIAEELGIRDSKKEELIFSLGSTLGLMAILTSMGSNLASRKLLRSLEKCFEAEEFLKDSGAVVMGALLAYMTSDTQWPAHFKAAQASHPTVLAVYTMFWRLSLYSYTHDEALVGKPLAETEEFLIERELQRERITRDAEAKQRRTELQRKLRKLRTDILADRAARNSIAGRRGEEANGPAGGPVNSLA